MVTTQHRMTDDQTPADIANRMLNGSSYHAIRALSCTFSQGVLTIGGHLPSFHLKQVAHQAIQGIEGVIRIDNQIEVARKHRTDS